MCWDARPTFHCVASRMPTSAVFVMFTNAAQAANKTPNRTDRFRSRTEPIKQYLVGVCLFVSGCVCCFANVDISFVIKSFIQTQTHPHTDTRTRIETTGNRSGIKCLPRDSAVCKAGEREKKHAHQKRRGVQSMAHPEMRVGNGAAHIVRKTSASD